MELIDLKQALLPSKQIGLLPAKDRRLTSEQRQQQQQEPWTPVFSNVQEECRWRISYINHILKSGVRSEETISIHNNLRGQCLRWLRIAFLMGATVNDSNHVLNGGKHLQCYIRLCPEAKQLWDQMVQQAINEAKSIQQQTSITQRFTCIDHTNQSFVMEGEDLSDVIKEFEPRGLSLTRDEKHRMQQMLHSVRRYYCKRLNLTVERYSNFVCIRFALKPVMYEILVTTETLDGRTSATIPDSRAV